MIKRIGYLPRSQALLGNARPKSSAFIHVSVCVAQEEIASAEDLLWLRHPDTFPVER